MRDSLGLYLLGALHEDERTAVERHLAVCQRCCVEADEFGVAADALALLSRRDVYELMAELEPAEARPAPAAADPAPVAAGPAPVAAGPAPLRRPAPGRPGNRSRSGPGGLLRRLRDGPTRAVVSLVVLAVVLILSVGMALGLALGRTGAVAPAAITLAATARAADGTSGASLSVFFSGDAQGATIRATVTGLHKGERYQLYAVASDGRTRVVCHWLGSEGAQDVGGTIELPATTLSFFTVTKMNGTTIVSAYVARSPSAHTS
jgi:hypothetical protein